LVESIAVLDLPSGPLTLHRLGEHGRPLLYLHPAGGVRLTPVIERLAASSRVFLPVSPGFDDTPQHESVRTVADLANLVADVIRFAIGERVDVVGHSLGGQTALWLALLAPELVDHLIVEAPDGLSESMPGFPKDLEALRALLFTHPERAGTNPKSSATIDANRTAGERYAAPGRIDRALIARLAEIEHLTLILQGTDDRVCPTENVRLLRRTLKHSYLTYIWDAAHSPEVDQPERTFALIDSFLTRSESFIVNWGTLAVSGQ
jgi:pimeloyl-ACP methyl ester carboxylesterase